MEEEESNIDKMYIKTFKNSKSKISNKEATIFDFLLVYIENLNIKENKSMCFCSNCLEIEVPPITEDIYFTPVMIQEYINKDKIKRIEDFGNYSGSRLYNKNYWDLINEIIIYREKCNYLSYEAEIKNIIEIKLRINDISHKECLIYNDFIIELRKKLSETKGDVKNYWSSILYEACKYIFKQLKTYNLNFLNLISKSEKNNFIIKNGNKYDLLKYEGEIKFSKKNSSHFTPKYEIYEIYGIKLSNKFKQKFDNNNLLSKDILGYDIKVFYDNLNTLNTPNFKLLKNEVDSNKNTLIFYAENYDDMSFMIENRTWDYDSRFGFVSNYKDKTLYLSFLFKTPDSYES